MTSYFSKVDKNQKQIVEGLRKLGYSVKPVHTVKNFVDIIVGHKGLNYLFEIKQDQKKKLTPGESKFFESWAGQKNVICSVKDAVEIIGMEYF